MARDKPRVPQTISDAQMADLRRRARAADREPWMSRRAAGRRLASIRQREQAGQN